MAKPAAPSAGASSPSAAASPRHYPLWPHCRACASELRNGARYCSYCGAPQLAGVRRPPPGSPPQPATAVPPPGPQPGPPPVTAGRPGGRRGRRRRAPIVPAVKGVFAFFGAMLGWLLGISAIAASMPESNPVVDVLVTVGLAVLVLGVVVPSGTVTRRSFAFRWREHLPIIAVALVGLAMFMLVYLALLTPLQSSLEGEDPNMVRDYVDNGWPLAAVLVLVAVCPAIFEELAFRGYIQTRLMRVLTVREALIVQAVLFSLLHLALLSLVSHTVMGLVFGWLRYKTKSLVPVMLLHFLWNTSVTLFEYSMLEPARLLALVG